MDNNLDNNQGGRRPDKGDPRRNQDPNRNKKNHSCKLYAHPAESLFQTRSSILQFAP